MAKKVAPKKPAPKKSAGPKKPVAKKSAPSKKVVAKKSPAKKIAPKAKVVVKKVVSKAKPVAKKVIAKSKPVAKKTVKPIVKKAVLKAKPIVKKVVKATKAKPVAKKPVAKPVAKPAAKKVEIKKVVAKPTPKEKAKPVVKALKPIAPVKESKKEAKLPKKEVVIIEEPKAKTPALPKDMEIKKAPTHSRRQQTMGESILNRPIDIKKLKLDESIIPHNKVIEPAKTIKHEQKDKRNRYNDQELQEFKVIILHKLEEARKDYDILKDSLSHRDNHGTDDTSPTFKLLEDGSDVLSREETAQLAGRQKKFIESLENALIRIENKTYGICRVSGLLISKERLRSVPHATLSIEAKLDQRSN